MKIKTAFTLSEVIMCLLAIGIIAALTIPSLMAGINDTQRKTAYKKVINVLSNITGTESVTGTIVATSDALAVRNMYDALRQNLNVKDYYPAPENLEDSSLADSSLYSGNIELEEDVDISPWIITEDNIAYLVTHLGNDNCGTKADILSAENYEEAFNAACVVLIVDLNGLSDFPNSFDEQEANAPALVNTRLRPLTGDRFYVFVARDGITGGSQTATIEGRIMSNSTR